MARHERDRGAVNVESRGFFPIKLLGSVGRLLGMSDEDKKRQHEALGKLLLAYAAAYRDLRRFIEQSGCASLLKPALAHLDLSDRPED